MALHSMFLQGYPTMDHKQAVDALYINIVSSCVDMLNCVTRTLSHFEQQCCHFCAFSPSLFERRGDVENMYEHGENHIKATGLYLYDNGPLQAELHLCGFAISVCK